MSEGDPTAESINNPDKLNEVIVETGIPDNLMNRSGIAFLLESIASEEADPEAKLIEILEGLRAIPDERERMLKLIAIFDQYHEKRIRREDLKSQEWLNKNRIMSKAFKEAQIRGGQIPEWILSVNDGFLPEWYLADDAIKDELAAMKSGNRDASPSLSNPPEFPSQSL